MIMTMVPSRGRPDSVRELFMAFEETCTVKSTGLWIAIDVDDPTMGLYKKMFDEFMQRDWNFTWCATLDRRMRLGGTLNSIADSAASFSSLVALGFMGDDHRPRTKGWDKTFTDYFMDTVNAVVYGNDLIHGEALPTAVFMDRRIVSRLGHFVIPGQVHLFMDNYWKSLGEKLGTLKYFPDVIIEHMHPIANKSEMDDTYREANDDVVWEHDEALYKHWLATQADADIARILA